MSFDHDRLIDSIALSDDEPKPCICRYKPSAAVVFVFDALIFVMLTTVLLLVATAAVRGDQEVTVKPGRLKKIETKLDGKKILWRPVGDFDLIEDSSGKYATTLFPITGKYQILVVTAKADEPLTETITITVEGEKPIPPGPGPDPKPPVDDLAAKIGTAWQMEFAADKAASAKALASVYRYGKARLDDSATWGEVFSRMSTQATAVGATDKIVNVQLVIQSALVSSLPTSGSARVDADSKSKGGALFDRIATILEGLR